ncbi:PEGA domain-containing protein [Methanocalculus taiwanensis]|uniref:PEGA domain-containing protein n=1 Tax=Methanocalculus taiwanensis TaxID=106207 RepID=A0ABD4TGF9_9EURY|nr:PEGA domain-containing protein [Methanocalculus taiwanensis]MCQ1538063.1 PEGA domain-containing protein [Methanocalculus taiwanensis]
MQILTSILIIGGLLCLALCIPPAAAEPTGTIQITSEPDGAEVYITNVFRGYTPLTVTDLRAGMIRFQLKKAGSYRNWNGVAYIMPQETVSVHAVMARGETQFNDYGSIVINSDPGTSVFQNQNFVGTTDDAGSYIISRADLGLHLINLQKEGYQSYSELVSVESGKTSGVTAALIPTGAAPVQVPAQATQVPAAPLPTAPEQSAGSTGIVISGILLGVACLLITRRT